MTNLSYFNFDLKFQIRHGIWWVYGLVTVLYIVILGQIPESARFEFTTFFILSDTSVLGVTLIGALVLLEKQQHVFANLRVTPMPKELYFFSKVISLTFLAIIVSLAIYLIPNHPKTAWPLILIGVAGSSFCFAFIGMGIAFRVDTLNGYLFNVIAGTLGLILPVIPFVLLGQPRWLLIFPTNATLDIFFLSRSSQPWIWGIIDTGILTVWTFLGYQFCKRQYRRHIEEGRA